MEIINNLVVPDPSFENASEILNLELSRPIIGPAIAISPKIIVPIVAKTNKYPDIFLFLFALINRTIQTEVANANIAPLDPLRNARRTIRNEKINLNILFFLETKNETQRIVEICAHDIPNVFVFTSLAIVKRPSTNVFDNNTDT